jgi:hypothetical protein
MGEARREIPKWRRNGRSSVKLPRYQGRVNQGERPMQRLKKPGYRFIAELVMLPSAIGMASLILSLLAQ